jgi:nitroreductase
MFLSLIEKRRSIRQFEAKSIEPGLIDLLVEAGLRAPSSKNRTPWEFIVVTDKELLKKLAETKPSGSSFLGNAPLAIVICGDPEQSDLWIEDTCIASIFIHLAATSLGLGSCWIQIRQRDHDQEKPAEDYVKDVLQIPSRLKVLSMVAIGYPSSRKSPRSKSELKWEKVYYDNFGKTLNDWKYLK